MTIRTTSTARSLRERLGALRAGAYAEVMPYQDPHTAAPALWALRHSGQAQWEISVSIVSHGPAERKGLEALAMSLYRKEHGASLTVCFGRCHAATSCRHPTMPGSLLPGHVLKEGPTPRPRNHRRASEFMRISAEHQPRRGGSVGNGPLGRVFGDRHKDRDRRYAI